MSTEKWTEPDRDAEALAEGFFSQPPAGLLDTGTEPWEAEPMSAGNRRAMVATLGLLGCSAAASLVFALVSEHVLVAPAQLAGAANLTSLPSSIAPVAERVHAASQPVALVAAPRVERIASPPESARAHVPAPAPLRTAAAPTDSEAQQLTRRAYRELGHGNAREAEQLANLALLQDGTRAETYIVLAGARDALGNTEGARSAIRACVMHAQDRLAATCKTLAR